MKNLIILTGLLLACCSLSAQVWDGGGGDTEWNNPQNWDTDMVPLPGALVRFTQSVAVTSGSGTVLTPAQVRVQGANTTLTLDFDLTVGSFTTVATAIRVDGLASLVIPSSRTLTITTAATNDAIAVPATAGGPTITIEDGAIINVVLGNNGINLASPNAILNNQGTIVMSQSNADGIFLASGATLNNTGSIAVNFANADGIDNAGNINNSGSIVLISSNLKSIRNNSTANFSNAGSIDVLDFLMTTNDGIFSTGIFTNEASGTINVTAMMDDGVEIQGGTFTNSGTMDLVGGNTAATGNEVLVVGSSTATATFINQGTLNANAGAGSSARAIFLGRDVAGVNSVFENQGRVTLSGGNAFQRFYSRGNTTNQPTGTIDSGDGLINVNRGTFVNNGLIEGDFPGTTNVSTGADGTSLNDGFYRHNGSSFSNGVTANITDNGVDMNDPAQTTFDLMGGCTVTVAGPGATQTWLNSLGDVVDAMGPEITFNDALPNVMSATISAVGIDVMLTVENVCIDGLLPIELINFTATALDKSVLLAWKTATEIDNDYMVVERSTDARLFTDIGRVDGAGTTYTPRTYELEDRFPANGINYYRLRQVDIDGTTSFSEIISVTFQGTNQPSLIPIAPNPVRKDGTIQIDLREMEPSITHYFITNSQGQIAATYDLAGGRRYPIDLSNLPAGLYVLSSSNDYGSSKFLIVE